MHGLLPSRDWAGVSCIQNSENRLSSRVQLMVMAKYQRFHAVVFTVAIAIGRRERDKFLS